MANAGIHPDRFSDLSPQKNLALAHRTAMRAAVCSATSIEESMHAQEHVPAANISNLILPLYLTPLITLQYTEFENVYDTTTTNRFVEAITNLTALNEKHAHGNNFGKYNLPSLPFLLSRTLLDATKHFALAQEEPNLSDLSHLQNFWSQALHQELMADMPYEYYLRPLEDDLFQLSEGNNATQELHHKPLFSEPNKDWAERLIFLSEMGMEDIWQTYEALMMSGEFLQENMQLRLNLYTHYDINIRRAFTTAQYLAFAQSEKQEIELFHLFQGLVLLAFAQEPQKDALTLIQQMGLFDETQIHTHFPLPRNLEDEQRFQNDPITIPVLSPVAQQALDFSTQFAKKTNSDIVAIRHMLGVLLSWQEGGQESDTLSSFIAAITTDTAQLQTAFRNYILDTHPEDEQEAWLQLFNMEVKSEEETHTDQVIRYINDNPFFDEDDPPLEDDPLKRARDLRVLAGLLASQNVTPPLSLGLFGDWGQGKSFFMDQLKKQISFFSKSGNENFHKEVKHITFNAWHYSDANLWASLISHIFSELCKSDTTQKDNEAYSSALAQKLMSLRLTSELYGSELSKLAQKREELEKSVATLDQVGQTKIHILNDLEQIKTLLPQKTLQHLNEEAKRFGLDKIEAEVESITQLINEVKEKIEPVTGRLKYLICGPGFERRWLYLMGALALTWSFWHLLPALEPWAKSLLTSLTAVLTGIRIFIQSGWEKVKPFLQALNDAKNSVDERQEERQKIVEKQKALLDQEEETKQKIADIKKQIKDLEITLLPEYHPRKLYQFLQDRAESTDYQSHLGLITIIRKDLENLSDWLQNKNTRPEEIEDLPYIDRIILYVDDLDRCPAHRVVEVLQAVHLLLALPVFIAVVAVDPRWLQKALRTEYKDFLTDTSSKRKNESDDWVATPRDYMEKIFQISYTLPEMGNSGFENLMDDLLNDDPEKKPDQTLKKADVIPQSTESQANQNEVDAVAASDQQSDNRPIRHEERPAHQNIEAINNADLLDEEIKKEPDATTRSKNLTQLEDQNKAKRQQQVVQEIVKRLRLNGWEIEILKCMGEFISTPRTAKRLLNTYRLIRGTMSDQQIAEFEKKSENAVETSCAILLLSSIYVGLPDVASYMTSFFNSKYNADTWENLATEIETKLSEKTLSVSEKIELGRLINGFKTLSSKRLDQSKPLEIPSPGVLKNWIDRVRRFSFAVRAN